jgi:hypothetical protein
MVAGISSVVQREEKVTVIIRANMRAVVLWWLGVGERKMIFC